MESRIADLRCKEIINVSDGCRFGYVGDVEVDLESGRVTALVVPGRLRLFGLLGREGAAIKRGIFTAQNGKNACNGRKPVIKYHSCAKARYYTHARMGVPCLL